MRLATCKTSMPLGAATDENGAGLAELGVPWCGKPVCKTDAWGLPGTANCAASTATARRVQKPRHAACR
jgi:hypothetical protein